MVSILLWAALLPSQDVDSRWTPWLGCFQLIEDESREPQGRPGDEELVREAAVAPGGRVCLEPNAGGVRVSTFQDGEAFLEEVQIADGERRATRAGNCTGWQSMEWSNDGRRLYSRSELACEDGRKRALSGISLFVGYSTWVEIQSVESSQARAVLVRRYVPADEDETLELTGLPMETLREAARARMVAGAALSTSDVIEATSKAETDAVEAALAEIGSGFGLDARALVRLDEAGVAPAIIDLMVALSYPNRFVVEGSGVGGGTTSFYDPYFTSAFGYPYYYAPFGYYYWYAPYDPVYVVRPIPNPGASVGRVVEGRGYTRVSPRDPARDGGRRAKWRGGSDGRNADSAGSDGISSSAAATPAGYTRSGASGRSAKPKKK